MRYAPKECWGCEHQCVCCASSLDGVGCSGCEGKDRDEFSLLSHIKYCPVTGEQRRYP